MAVVTRLLTKAAYESERQRTFTQNRNWTIARWNLSAAVCICFALVSTKTKKKTLKNKTATLAIRALGCVWRDRKLGLTAKKKHFSQLKGLSVQLSISH